MHELKRVSAYQFGVFRILLGLYLLWHFTGLYFYSAELFSAEGVFPDAATNLTFPYFPNPLYVWDSPQAVNLFLIVLFGASGLFACGVMRRPAALILWFGWTALFHRNNLIANPSLPYVGLILLLTLLVSPAEKLRPQRRAPAGNAWSFPASVYHCAWWLLMAGYSYSGFVKLSSPSWLDGSAFTHVIANPLARDGWIRDLVSALPEGALRLATWGALGIEILALPLAFANKTRPWIWLATLGLQVGILLVVNFTDLTLGMVMIHLFTFDPDWLPPRPGKRGRHLVLYDGVCGLCDRTVQFLLEEDRAGVLSFAPLQGSTAAELRESIGRDADMSTMLFVEDHDAARHRVTSRSTGVLRMLDAVGGFWRVVSWLRIVPRPIRNSVYRVISRYRYAWFGKFDSCKLPAAETRQRFLD
ncbi:MAG: DCC1-like thiol-disulfide oxidoreductase family protein [Thermoanaerobaculia bacterium]